ncbi:hypothetical protein CROQUDRAFT_653335 [Cronartium quercuum f. sp. fusiforme G11]|uniref:CFEM domain-containing protein n=1 Tax=Cronartium quercuum f. sp. fusiforme G11 TaxID=708437 RepID=A0A9P6NT21_9BASI|nr:hypothetical protein CROQUDRAFT_653335 [Cronartium quercuum f. sp. fusiforme G11]
MLSQSILATILSASAVFAATSPAASAAGAKTLTPANIPECATACMNTKISEAATWYGPGDLAAYCTHPNFLVAYNSCLKDHCQGTDFTTGQQAGAAACGTDLSALNATLPAATNATSGTTTSDNSANVTSDNSATTSTGISGSSSNTSLAATGSGNTSGSLTGGNSTTTTATTTTTTPTGLNSSSAGSNRSSTGTASPATTTSRFGNSSTPASGGASNSPASIVRADFALLGSSLIVLFTSFFF